MFEFFHQIKLNPMSIQTNLKIIIQNRKACKKIMDGLSIEQINQVPAGFNNNIIWNCAHILSVQQFLIYGVAGRSFTISNEQISEFTMGTRPEKMYDEAFIDHIKSQFFSTFEQMEEDIENNVFEEFNTFMTAIRVEVNDIASAVAFNQYHEALHMGYLLNIRRFL